MSAENHNMHVNLYIHTTVYRIMVFPLTLRLLRRWPSSGGG